MPLWAIGLLAGVILALAYDAYPPKEWMPRFQAWRSGARYHSAQTFKALIPRKLKNWWGRRQGFSGCLRCHDSWWWKPKHVTMYQDDAPSRENAGQITGAGCFALCEQCWVWLGTPKDRLPYYAALIAWWAQDSPVPLDQQRQIFSAVAEGK